MQFPSDGRSVDQEGLQFASWKFKKGICAAIRGCHSRHCCHNQTCLFGDRGPDSWNSIWPNIYKSDRRSDRGDKSKEDETLDSIRIDHRHVDYSLPQFTLVLDHLKAHNLLHNRPDTCLIDLGSGKAQLIYWLAKQAPRCRFLLIDRMGSRNKFDNKARNVTSFLDSFHFCRFLGWSEFANHSTALLNRSSRFGSSSDYSGGLVFHAFTGDDLKHFRNAKIRSLLSASTSVETQWTR